MKLLSSLERDDRTGAAGLSGIFSKCVSGILPDRSMADSYVAPSLTSEVDTLEKNKDINE